jgi:hypothetical protein
MQEAVKGEFYMGDSIGIHVSKVFTGYDSADDAYKIKSTQKKWRDSFTGASLSASKWMTVQTGAGMTVTVGSGVLTIATGTTINSETILESVEYFTVPFRTLFGLMVSVRQANQEFYVEAVSIDPVTKAADGLHGMAWKMDFTGTNANYANYEVWNGGLARVSANVYGNVWTSYIIKELELFPDEAWFHDRNMDSSSGRTASNVRHQQIPDPNALYKIRIRAKNLGTAPGASADFRLQFVNVVDFAELTAEITAGRGSVSGGQGIYATVGGSVTANLQQNALVYTDTTANLGVSSTYTGGARDAGEGSTSRLQYTRFRVMTLHTAGNVHGHLVIEQSTDNTTYRETHRVPVPSDGLYRTFEFPCLLRYVRVKFINGTIAQTAMYLATALIHSDGNFDFDKMIQFIDSTTVLAGAATFTGVTLNLGANHSFIKFRARVYSDQGGTLFIDQSRDGVAWRTVGAGASVAAGAAVELEQNVMCQYVRVRYVNGATLQTVFDLVSSLVKA